MLEFLSCSRGGRRGVSDRRAVVGVVGSRDGGGRRSMIFGGRFVRSCCGSFAKDEELILLLQTILLRMIKNDIEEQNCTF